MDVFLVFLIIINFCHIQSTEGVCPVNCKHTVTCPDSDCPYGDCKIGWWGRRCEFPLECQIPSNYGAYRGTRNVSIGNLPCQDWIHFTDKNPGDGRVNASNHCRKGDNDEFLWCFTIRGNRTIRKWVKCNITNCDDQCPPPDIPPHTRVWPSKDGFQVNSHLEVQCDDGYKPRKKRNITCGSDKMWKKMKPCREICPEPTLARNSYIHASSIKTLYAAGDNMTIRCATGFQIHGSNTLMCLATKTWSLPVPTCQVTCPPPSLSQHSYVVNHAQIYTAGDSVEIACDPGYDINGSRSIMCQTNRSWNKQAPTCSAIRCRGFGTLGPNVHIGDERNSYEYQDSVTFICDQGFETYHQTNTTELRCEHDGNWSVAVPTCKVRCPSQCDPRSDCSQSADHACPYRKCNPGWWGRQCEQRRQCLPRDASHYFGTKNITRSGQVCDRWDVDLSQKKDIPSYTQPPDDPSPENYCRHADTTHGVWCYIDVRTNMRWDSCEVQPCDEQCEPPDINIYSFVEDPPVDGFPEGGTITIFCDDGFVLSGSSTLQCLHNDSYQWSASTPVCKEICPTPTPSSHSYLVNANKTYVVGDTLTIACDPGYEILGNRTIMCLTNRSWSHPVHTCTAICDLPTTKPHSSIINKANVYRYEDLLEVKCESGYETSNQTRFSCRDDRSWNGAMPICLEIVCDSGFETANRTQFYCQDDMGWNGTIPLCLALCESPVTKVHSYIVNEADIYRYGDGIEVLCDSGYETANHTRFTCRDDRSWGGVMPVCLGTIYTSICDKPSTATYSYIKNELDKYRHNDIITIACESGYTMAGESEFVCQDDRTWSGDFPICEEQPSSASAVGGTVGALCFLFLLALIVFLIRKRRNRHPPKADVGVIYNANDDDPEVAIVSVPACNGRRKDENIYANVHKEGEASNTYYDFFSAKPSVNAVSKDTFQDYVASRMADKASFTPEYTSLDLGINKTSNVALRPENKVKNKYKNIFPYDDNRVTLAPREGEEDYINASYINGVMINYIASQGPIETSINDFWRMIWEQQAKCIVMLTNVFENRKKKCVQYWPEKKESRTFKDIQVYLNEEQVNFEFTRRNMSLQRGGERRTVTQFHFTVWPDKGVPKFASSLVNFRNKVIKHPGAKTAPLLVHCSAGVGRTGTFIALDYLIKQAETTGYVDVQKCVQTLREQRMKMVQTQEQYIFLHQVVLEALAATKFTLSQHDFSERYQRILAGEEFSLEQIYSDMQGWTETRADEDFASAKLPKNVRKNRNKSILPVDRERPILQMESDNDTGYINAVFLASVTDHKAFITTQMPLSNTITDFWKLVHEQNVSSIVMLNDVTDKSCGIYWPMADEQKQFGSFSVSHTETVHKPFGEVSTFILKKNKETHVVKQYRSTVWPDTMKVPASTSQFLDLITTVHGEKEEGPIVVHCMDGATKCGVYCTVAVAFQQMETERDVNIPQIIQRFRHARPQMIQTLEQFRFCYDVMEEYLNMFGTYQNI